VIFFGFGSLVGDSLTGRHDGRAGDETGKKNSMGGRLNLIRVSARLYAWPLGCGFFFVGEDRKEGVVLHSRARQQAGRYRIEFTMGNLWKGWE